MANINLINHQKTHYAGTDNVKEESKNEFQASKKPFNFSNLGWGRKTYLIIIWLFTIAILWVGANDIIKEPADDVPVAVYVLLLFLFLASACWKHYAISKEEPLTY